MLRKLCNPVSGRTLRVSKRHFLESTITQEPIFYETNERAGSSGDQPHAPSINTETIAPSAELPPKGETGKPPGNFKL